MQHSQPRVLHGIECPFVDVVGLMVIGFFDFGGFGYCFSLALTSLFARLSVLLRLRHGLGTLLISLLLGLRIPLSVLVSRFGV